MEIEANILFLRNWKERYGTHGRLSIHAVSSARHIGNEFPAAIGAAPNRCRE